MATRITTVQFKTQGAELTEQQLERIAKAAERMAERIRKGPPDATPGLRALDAAMKDVRATAEGVASRFGPLGSAIAALGPTGTLAAAGVVGVVGGLTTLAIQAITSTDALKDQAQQLGVSTRLYQELTFAGGQVGVSQQQISTGLRTFTKSLADASRGTGELVTVLKSVNPELLQSVQRAGSVEEAFRLMASGIQDLPTRFQQSQVAIAAFGSRSGAALVPLVTEFDRLARRAHELGIVLDDSLIARADTAGDQLDELSQTIRASLNASLLSLAPTIESIALGFTNLIAKAREFAQQRFGTGIALPNLRAHEITAELADLEDRQRRLQSGIAGFGGLSPEQALTGPTTINEVNARIAALVRERDEIFRTAAAERERETQAQRAAQALAAADQATARWEERRRTAFQRITQERDEDLAAIDRAVQAEALSEAAAAERRLTIRRTFEDEVAKLDKEGAQRRKQAETERQKALAETAKLERAASLAGLEGLALLERQRDQALADEQARLAAGEIDHEQFLRRKLAHETIFAADVAALQERAAEEARTTRERELQELARAEARAAEQAAAQFRAPFENAFEGIQRTAADVFTSLWSGTIDDADDAADAILGIFQRMLGELSALAVARAFEPLVAQIAGIARGGVSPAGGSGSGGAGSGQLITGGVGFLGRLFGLSGTEAAGATAGTAGLNLSSLFQIAGLGAGTLALLNRDTHPALRALSGLSTLNSAANLFGLGLGIGQLGPGGPAALTLAGHPILAGGPSALGSLAGLLGGTIGPIGAGGGLSTAAAVGTIGNISLAGSAAIPGAIALADGTIGTVVGLTQTGGALVQLASGEVIAISAAELANAGAAPIAGGLSAAAGALGAVGGVVAAGLASYSFNEALSRFDSGRFEFNTSNRLTFGMTPPFVSGPMLIARGNTQAGLLTLANPFLSHIDQILDTNILGMQAEAEDYLREFSEALEEELDRVTGTRAFSAPGRVGRRGARLRRQIARDDDTGFLLGVASGGIMEATLRAPVGALRRFPEGIREEARGEILGGLANIAARGGDVQAALEKIIRALVGFQSAVDFTNRAFLEQGSTALRVGESAEEMGDKLALIVDIFDRQLPRGLDATAVAARTLARDQVASVARIRQAASELSRLDAAESLRFRGLDPEEPFRIRAGRIGAPDERGRRARAALTVAESAAQEAAFRTELGIRFAGDPAAPLRELFADVQAAFDTLATVKKPKDLRDAGVAVIEGLQGLGDGLVGLVAQLVEARVAIEDRVLALGEEEDALRKSTDTHHRYDDVISITERRLAEQTSAAGRVAQIERLIGLERARAQAEITDIQEAATVRLEALQDELEGIDALAGIAAGIRDQIQAIQFSQLETPLAQLAFLGDELARQQTRFRTEPEDDERAEAAQEVSALIGQQLQLAAQIFGPGSSEFLALQRQGLAALAEIEAETTPAEERRDAILEESRDIQEETRDKIDAINATLAGTLERLGGPLTAALEEQRAALETAVTETLATLGIDIDDVLGDPVAAQVRIQTAILEEIAGVNAQIGRFLDRARGRRDAGPFDDEDAGRPERAFAQGVDAIFTQPTRAIFAEAGPEHVRITPLGGTGTSGVARGPAGGGGIHLTIQHLSIAIPPTVRSVHEAKLWMREAAGEFTANVQATVRRMGGLQ